MGIAEILSKLFEPLFVLFILMAMEGFRVGLPLHSRLWFVLYVTILFLTIVFVRIWMGRRWKLDWDITDRRKRIRPLLILMGVILGNWFVIRLWHSVELVNLFYLFALWLFGFFLITLRYKISGHVGVVTIAGCLLVSWFGRAWWPILATVPLVAWARVGGNYHTLGEVVGGALYSLAFSFFSFPVFVLG